MENSQNSDRIETLSDIDSLQVVTNFQSLRTYEDTTDDIYDKKSALMKKLYRVNKLKNHTEEMIDALDLEKNGDDDEIDSTTVGSSFENKSTLEELRNEVKRLKVLLEDKEEQLETAAKYGITLLKNNESLQELLEKNEDVWKLKFEELKNEEFSLRKQIEIHKLEHDSITNDLRSDLCHITTELEKEKSNYSSMEKELNEKIKQLTMSNETLTDQMLNASLQEEEKSCEMSHLRLRVSESDDRLQQQITNLQNELSDAKVEMERVLRVKGEECRLLSTSLDQVHEKLLSVEKERISETIRAEQLQGDLMRLEDKYVVLLAKSNELPTEHEHPTTNEVSLFAELDVLSDAMQSHEMINGRSCFNNRGNLGTQLRQEILEVYRQVQRLIMQVRGEGHLWSPEVVDINDLKAGQLLLSLTTLQQLLDRRFHTESLPPLFDEQTKLERQIEHLTDNIINLKEQLTTTRTTLERVKEELCLRDVQLQSARDTSNALEKMVHDYRDGMEVLQKRIDNLRTTPLSDSQAILQANQDRDHALKKCECLEDDVLRLRAELKALDRQVMGLVDQKVQLSNQLEAWQNDMHELLENKMAGEIERDSLRTTLKPLSFSSSSSSSSSSSKNSNNNNNKHTLKKRFSLKWS